MVNLLDLGKRLYYNANSDLYMNGTISSTETTFDSSTSSETATTSSTPIITSSDDNSSVTIPETLSSSLISSSTTEYTSSLPIQSSTSSSSFDTESSLIKLSNSDVSLLSSATTTIDQTDTTKTSSSSSSATTTTHNNLDQNSLNMILHSSSGSITSVTIPTSTSSGEDESSSIQSDLNSGLSSQSNEKTGSVSSYESSSFIITESASSSSSSLSPSSSFSSSTSPSLTNTVKVTTKIAKPSSTSTSASIITITPSTSSTPDDDDNSTYFAYSETYSPFVYTTTFSYTQAVVVTDSQSTMTTTVQLNSDLTYSDKATLSHITFPSTITTDSSGLRKLISVDSSGKATSKPASSLSAGGIAGVAVGGVAGILLCLVLVLFCWRRRKTKRGASVYGESDLPLDVEKNRTTSTTFDVHGDVADSPDFNSHGFTEKIINPNKSSNNYDAIESNLTDMRNILAAQAHDCKNSPPPPPPARKSRSMNHHSNDFYTSPTPPLLNASNNSSNERVMHVLYENEEEDISDPEHNSTLAGSNFDSHETHLDPFSSNTLTPRKQRYLSASQQYQYSQGGSGNETGTGLLGSNPAPLVPLRSLPNSATPSPPKSRKSRKSPAVSPQSGLQFSRPVLQAGLKDFSTSPHHGRTDSGVVVDTLSSFIFSNGKIKSSTRPEHQHHPEEQIDNHHHQQQQKQQQQQQQERDLTSSFGNINSSSSYSRKTNNAYSRLNSQSQRSGNSSTNGSCFEDGDDIDTDDVYSSSLGSESDDGFLAHN